MDDKEIIAGIRKGEVELFRLLVERYHQRLLVFIHTITRDRFLAEDVGQAVFISFFQSLDRFDETQETPVLAWLFVVARNQAINAIKKERRYVVGIHETIQSKDTRPGPLDLLIQREDQAALYQSLKQLPEPYRSTLRNSLEGYSIREISAKELVLTGTVKSRLARARLKLLKIIQANTRS